DASPGTYALQVKQLAQNHKIGAQGWADQNTTTVASGGGGSFSFKVGSAGAVKTVSVGSSMTLQGLRDGINNLNAGVTASIINDGTSTNPYRLVLTSNSSGASNNIVITTNNTQLDFTNKQIESAYAKTGNSYAGTSTSGGTYTGTANKTYLLKVVTGGTPGSGTAKYKYSIDSGINWLGAGGAAYSGSNGVTVAADNSLQNIDGLADGITTTEGAKVKFAGGTLAADDQFSIDVFNPEFQTAQDAVVTVDNLTLTKSGNTITDAIQGVTLNLLKVDSSASVTLTVGGETATAVSKIKSFVSAYNDVIKYLDEQLSYDPKAANQKPLMGDVTVTGVQRSLRNMISGTIPGLTTGKLNLSQIGITSDSKTGELKVDDSKVSSALSSDLEGVRKLFMAVGAASNVAVSYVGKTGKTQPGSHSIEITTAPEKAAFSGDQGIQAGGITSQETLTFKYSKDYTAGAPAYTTFNVTLSAGRTAAQVVDDLNSAFATNSVGLVASQSGNVLTVTSSGYGGDIYFQAVSDQASSSAQSGIGTTAKSDAGVTVEGLINGRKAVGKGNQMTSKSGSREDGLTISATATSTGLYGTVTLSLGVADRLTEILDGYIDPTTGKLQAKEDGYQSTMEDIEAQIARIQERLAEKERTIRNRFARLESIIGKYKSQGDALSSVLSQLSAGWLRK
ncbi:MAG: flagellar filament capping protein FliD, partial [Nitrospirae bacterium]|nr:flagellar filament capping protein FliD [Nitrospirota bacterium]